MSLPDVVVGGALAVLGSSGAAWWANRRAADADQRRFAHERDLERERRTQERRASAYVAMLEYANQVVAVFGREVQDRIFRVEVLQPPVPRIAPENPYNLVSTIGALASDEVRQLADAFEERHHRIDLGLAQFDATKAGQLPEPPDALTQLNGLFQALKDAREALRAQIAEELSG